MVCKPLYYIKCPDGEIQKGLWYYNEFLGDSKNPKPRPNAPKSQPDDSKPRQDDSRPQPDDSQP